MVRSSDRLRVVAMVIAFFWTLAAQGADRSEAVSVDLGGGVRLEAVPAPAGEFTQGSPGDEVDRVDDETQRRVVLSKRFYIGKTAVTRGQWERFVQETGYRTEAEVGESGGYGWDGTTLSQRKEFNWRNPGFAQTSNHPVCIVTAPDAEAFCQWLTRKAGRSVSLPTEAQWEYACRAGTTTPWHNGAKEPADSTGIAWSKLNAKNATHPVDELKPNAWGLHIGGNVAEWCQDVYAPYPPGAATDPLATTPTVGEKVRRVLRGGSWNRDAKQTRSAARSRADARSRNADIGFRVVLAADGAAAARGDASSTPGAASVPPAASEEPVAGPPVVVPQPPESGSGGWSALCCIGPVLAVLGYVGFRVVRAASPSRGVGSPGASRAGAAVATGFAAGAAARAMAGSGNAETRIAEDGFLVTLLNAAPRSQFHYEYLPADGGSVVTGFDVYEPGPQGHFIYTGGTPKSARVTRIGSVGSGTGSEAESETESGPDDDSDFDTSIDDGGDDSGPTPPPLPGRSMGSSSTSRRSGGSSHHPSAY